MDLEHRVSRLEGKHNGPWRREDLFDHVSDDELKAIYRRVRSVVSEEEGAMLDKQFGAYFGEVHEGGPG
jgi:hypothetical protein